MVLSGTFEHAIDAKHRIAIPAEIRAALRSAGRDVEVGAVDSVNDGKSAAAGRNDDEPLALYVTLGTTEDGAGSLWIYRQREFEQLAEDLNQSERDTEDLLQFETVFYSLSHRVEMDRNGRVRLPESLLERSGLTSEVVIIGAKDHLEIRDRAAWAAYVERVLVERHRFVMNPRQAMRRPSRSAESE